MGRRSKLKKEKTRPPKGLSRYAMKVRGLLPPKPQPEASVSNPAPPHWNKPAMMTTPPIQRVVPAGTELVTAKVSGINLRTGGYVFLVDRQNRRIYLSDGVLEKFDTKFFIDTGFFIECAVQREERGFRAVEVYSIQPPR